MVALGVTGTELLMNSPVEILLIGPHARGIKTLTCATHGSLRPCVVQFSVSMPRAADAVAGIRKKDRMPQKTADFRGW